MNWLNLISAVCLLGGAASCLFGAIGLLTFPDVAARLQAATKPQTLGLILVLIGSAVRLDVRDASGLILVGLFQALTAPVLAQLVGRAAYRAGSVREETLDADDLAKRIERERGRTL
ncbi:MULTISPECIES: monovalent cation/H(+) antiporter subunit G [Actinopolyspora]|uniref:Multisubunit sodium/proton antiporter, MrpG subunit n=1 Tax=Actinopolyspora saharensis TaxID=995062 RepID=A0A1H1EF08_9ACTN|nr:monovalent cation/H(+) antiporter subunit G [Actinopolyspora saharensis]NHD19071.1 Na+/H+ antiporter subunit G [Actinopolyspora sp. BKK2]NHE78144.1 Na+/H+ antiporter subunit G [Actinopolyspora sp. BKK1]SDQ87411.1 multisubunit sodium/proton antiporter, MrpG subunit [Actinopolyspora saharensis]